MDFCTITSLIWALAAVLHVTLLIAAVKVLIRKKQVNSLEEWYNQKFQEVVTAPLAQKNTTLETATDVLKRAERLKRLYEELSQF